MCTEGKNIFFEDLCKFSPEKQPSCNLIVHCIIPLSQQATVKITFMF